MKLRLICINAPAMTYDKGVKAEAAEQDYAEDASTQFWVGFCLQPTRNQNLQVATDCTHRGGQPKVVPKRGLTYHRDGIIVAPPP
ncbi:MAG TPA: hypothetical protein VE980_14935 [Pyrinomonadaceae bacterium]|nr:hypothetical protein [Pyrinomonadaceae bacterium]